MARVEKKSKAVSLLTELRNEGQAWLDSRPVAYEDSDINADKQSEVEAFVEELDTIIESLGDLDIPDFRIRNRALATVCSEDD